MGLCVVVGCCTGVFRPEGEEIVPVRDPSGVKPWAIPPSLPMLLQTAQCVPATI